jgi:ParB family chromosome partitioning protein
MNMHQIQTEAQSIAVDISSIVVGDRFRKEMGDLEGLAESIAELGLLQPIGVTDDFTLIFGERRLRACRDLLGMTEIEVRIIDMPNIVVGENAENEVRKDFTPSERVAIAQAIEAEIGERRGRPSENPQNIAEIEKGQETRDFAAKQAGFGNRETYRQAKHVVGNAEPEVVEAMDNNVISITQARKISDLPPAEQRERIKTGAKVSDGQRKNVQTKRDWFVSQPELVQIQLLTDAVETLGIAAQAMPVEKYQGRANSVTRGRCHQQALAALVWLRQFTEVSNA